MPESAPPLFGLVLIGGGSTRMGQDKAFLAYHDLEEWERVRHCISPLVDQTYISLRSDQAEDKRFENELCIPDHWDNIGPMNGIASAMQSHPQAAYLVVPCDMPGLDEATVRSIINQRDIQCHATVYENDQGKLEPLCAIYEPIVQQALVESIAKKKFSLNRCLHEWYIQRVSMNSNMSTLNNINTPEESQRFRKHLLTPIKEDAI